MKLFDNKCKIVWAILILLFIPVFIFAQEDIYSEESSGYSDSSDITNTILSTPVGQGFTDEGFSDNFATPWEVFLMRMAFLALYVLLLWVGLNRLGILKGASLNAIRIAAIILGLIGALRLPYNVIFMLFDLFLFATILILLIKGIDFILAPLGKYFKGLIKAAIFAILAMLFWSWSEKSPADMPMGISSIATLLGNNAQMVFQFVSIALWIAAAWTLLKTMGATKALDERMDKVGWYRKMKGIDTKPEKMATRNIGEHVAELKNAFRRRKGIKDTIRIRDQANRMLDDVERIRGKVNHLDLEDEGPGGLF